METAAKLQEMLADRLAPKCQRSRTAWAGAQAELPELPEPGMQAPLVEEVQRLRGGRRRCSAGSGGRSG
jgi:hypothetical protein